MGNRVACGTAFGTRPATTWHSLNERKGTNKTLELEEAAERFDDLGVHQMAALDGLSPEDRDQSLVEYMLKRRTEVRARAYNTAYMQIHTHELVSTDNRWNYP